MLRKLRSLFTKTEFSNAGMELVVRQRRLELVCQSDQLSRDLCVHAAMLVNGTWHHTSEGLWQVNKGKDLLQVTIDWEKLPLRQIWQFRRIDCGYNWVVYTDVKEPLKIEKVICGVMLRQEYEQWFAGFEQGVFPGFNDFWDNIFLQDTEAKVLGAKASGVFPDFVLESLQPGKLLLQNAPRVLQSRALRVEIDKHGELIPANRYKDFNVNFYLFLKKENTAKFLEQKKLQLLEEKQLVEGCLKLKLEKSAAHIFWEGRQITINQGLHAAILVDKEWFDSSRAEWKVERINNQCLYVDLDWRPLPIKQSWQLNILDHRTISWKVKTVLKEQRVDLIKKMTLGVVLNPGYDQWLGGYESGSFPQTFGAWQEMILDNPSGEIGVKNKGALPGVLFKNADGADAGLLVQNGDESAKARFLQAIKFIPENELSGNLREFDFAQKITFIENTEEIESRIKEKIDAQVMRAGLSRGNLKIVFGQGKGRIFWQEQEITADIGLHSAVCSGGRWYDSGKAKWQVDKIALDKVRVKIDFTPFPAVQEWEFTLAKENILTWDIKMCLDWDVEISERKAGIILSGAYQEWFNSFEEGRFPERFSFWHDIIRNRDGETFGVYPCAAMPAVMFSIDDHHMSLIQNTDENIKGRVLQAQRVEAEETKNYEKQEFVCFHGEIKFTPQRMDIDAHRTAAQPLRYETEALFLNGDNEFLHDRIAGVNEFKEKIAKIKALKKSGAPLKLTIGVCRYNFFKLHEILKFAAECLGINRDMRSFKIPIFPLKKLRRNFIEYLEDLKKQAEEIGVIEFRLIDKDFFPMITEISAQADSGNERQLARLLGVICEHAFIGPQIVVIDPYHRCNANCVHCWVHTPGVFHPNEYYEKKLEVEDFKKIADDLSELMNDLIIFQGDGEPLLHGNFFDMVKYARGKGIQVSFFTNGILLNKANAEAAVENEISEIFCSLPAGTAKTFAKINTKQREKVFDQILDNLKYLCEIKKQKNNKPRLIMTHVIHTLNAHELVEMAKNDIAIGADVMRFYLIRLDENIKFLKLSEDDLRKIKAALAEIKTLVQGKAIELLDTTDFQLDNFEPESGSWSKNVFLENGCTLGWNFCLIPAAGDVSFCCHLRTVGYLKDKSFKEIWNSEDYRRFRYQAKYLSQNLQERFLNGTAMFDDYCQHCDTHQVIRDVWNQFKLYKLERFFDSGI